MSYVMGTRRSSAFIALAVSLVSLTVFAPAALAEGSGSERDPTASDDLFGDEEIADDDLFSAED